MKHQFRFVVDKAPNFDRAACKGVPTEVFFPNYLHFRGRITPKQIAKARQYCSVCPIQSECLEYACRTDSIGIWGGQYVSEHLARKLREEHGWSLHREVVTDIG